MDGVQDLHGCFAAILFVKHLVDLPVGPLPNGLHDVPGVRRIGEVIKHDRFSCLWKHLEERSPENEKERPLKSPNILSTFQI